MKTKTGIVHTVTKVAGNAKIVVKIRLDDDCKNGHCDFSLTSTVYERTKANRWQDISGGCNHEEILKWFPDFADFARLHLCDVHGAPMYAIENGLYWLKEKGFEACAEYLRISPELAAKLLPDDPNYSRYVLQTSGVLDMWQDEANKAIAHLESISGDKFVNPYTDETERRNCSPLSENETTMIESLIKSGFYTSEAIQKRNEEKQKAERDKKRNAIIERFDKDINEAKQKKAVYLAIFDIMGTTENVIFYHHSNTVCLNWQGYGKKWEHYQFTQLVEAAKESDALGGLRFEIK